jgi:hypothetical protein
MATRAVSVTGFPFSSPPREAADRWAGAELAEEQLRMLAVGAFYARSNRAYNDTLALLPEEAGAGTRRDWRMRGG